MNEVNVLDLKNEIAKFNSLIDTYQENYLNLYNEIKNSNIYWLGTKATRFYIAKEEEKLKIDITFEELNSIKDIYSYIVSRYGKLGDNIKFNLNNRDELLSKTNTYINKLKRVLSIYQRLDYSYASYSVKNNIYGQMNNIRIMISNATKLRDNIKRIVNEILESENKIRRMINQIQINNLPLPSVERFV